MDRKTFWNEAARWGLILGALLSLSFILEDRITHSGNLGTYVWFLLEWPAAVALHIWLLFRFVRQCRASYPAEVGFTFGQGYGAVMGVSLLAGVIVGVVQTVYLHLIIGYANYLQSTVDSLIGMLSDGTGRIPKGFEAYITQLIKQIQETPEPSVLSTFMGALFSTLFVAAIFGLIVAGCSSRRPRPFGDGRGEFHQEDATE